jgi:hypothetical protein
MYDREEKCCVKQQEHFEMATRMANDIKNFTLDQQNEMVKHIFHLVKEERLVRIKEAENTSQILHDSLKDYGNFNNTEQ